MNRDPDLFWPEKFLPVEAGISEARISTFGYDSNFKSGTKKNQMSILDFSQSLLRALKFTQDGLSEQEGELEMGKVSLILLHFTWSLC